MRAAGHGDTRRVSAHGRAGSVPVPGTAGVLVRWEARWDPADLGTPRFGAASYVVLEPPWELDPGKGWMAATAALGGAAGVLLDAGLLGAVVPGEDPGADAGALRRMADGRRLVELAAAAGVAAEASAWEAHLRALCRRAGLDRGAVSRMADALEVLRG